MEILNGIMNGDRVNLELSKPVVDLLERYVKSQEDIAAALKKLSTAVDANYGYATPRINIKNG